MFWGGRVEILLRVIIGTDRPDTDRSDAFEKAHCISNLCFEAVEPCAPDEHWENEFAFEYLFSSTRCRDLRSLD